MEQIVIGNPYEISFLHRTQGFKAKMTIAIVNIDHQMSYAGDRCCSDGGSSALSPIQRTADKKKLSSRRRHCRHHIRVTCLFAVAICMAEAMILFLHKSCNGFAPTGCLSPKHLPFPSPSQQRKEKREHHLHHLGLATTSDIDDSSISSILTIEEDINKTEGVFAARHSTQSTSFSLDLPSPQKSRRRRAWNFLKKKNRFWRTRSDESDNEAETTLNFSYDYDVVDIPVGANVPSKAKTTGIMLIHPIGVGIARWYYQRLVSSLVARQASIDENVVIVVPDLLGSGSACNATAGTEEAQKFPLFNISDWTDQVEALMSLVEAAPTASGSDRIDQWCVIANGGCSPIALQLAERKKIIEKNHSLGAPVSNLILSSVPRLPFFLKNETTNDPVKVAKSYRTLSGLPGKIFWWYSCRNNGAFIQTFSEKNLIADPKNLGPMWRSNCYETAISFDGKGKYATFSFLAGTLQDGCVPSLEAIKNSPLEINIIKGVDVRRNRAKSWFWQKPKEEKKKQYEKTPSAKETSDVTISTDSTTTGNPYETFRDYAEKNGNGGREVVIEGRISLAHEDPEGYADAIVKFLFDS